MTRRLWLRHPARTIRPDPCPVVCHRTQDLAQQALGTNQPRSLTISRCPQGRWRITSKETST